MTVLNPLQRVDERIMDDADLAGPIIFFFCFGIFLLFVGFSILMNSKLLLTYHDSLGNLTSATYMVLAFSGQPLCIPS